MKILYPISIVFFLSACAIQQPELVKVDTEKYPLDTDVANISFLRMEGAADHYNNRYKKLRSHKAFAQSRAGAWGFYGGQPNAELAMQEALNDCRKHNADNEKTEPCKIVNLDGYWGTQLFSGLPGPKPYTATEITNILADNSIVHSSNRTGFKRFFDKSGQHIFDPDRGFYLTGYWYVRETDNKLCDWEVDSKKPRCAAIKIEENLITLDYDGGLPFITKLVSGNATDPIDNPGLNFDPSTELALSELQDVVIQPPEATLETELAAFSGAWYGTWYAGRDFAIIVEQINPQTASLIYAWGPNKLNNRSQAGSIKTTAQLDGAKLRFKLWGDSGVLTLRPSGNLNIDWTSDDWSGRSIASRWPNPPWDSPITKKLETPDLTKPRTELTLFTLIDSEEPGTEPVHTGYFSAFGPSTEPAHHAFQGRIEFGSSRVVGRPAGNQGFRHYPGFPVISLDFYTVGDELVPQERHRLITRGADSPWDLIVEPGRVWSEAGDSGWSRAAFPFVLVEKQGTLLRNGVATFVYNADNMSPIHFQIGKESTANRHLDLWGLVQASYTPNSPSELQAWIDAYAREIADRINIHPWSELEARFGTELLDQFDGKRIRRHISKSGLIIDGEVYSSDCRTRYGPQPYCRHMRHAVYSVSKTLLGWLTTLRMAQKYGAEIMQYKVSDLVELKTNDKHWKDVTIEHLLSMVSGIGDYEPTRVSYYVETIGTSSEMALARAATWKDKLAVVETTGFYRWGPGKVFRYASFDPFILALALSELHRRKEGANANLWEMMNHEVFRPIGIANLPIRQTPADERGYSVPIFSYGAFVTLEDVAKIETLIRADGNFGGQQILHAELLKESFDGTVEKSGYPTGWINNTGEESRYFRYFWHGLYSSTTGCKVLAPLMSGWGGNAVLIMPNGITALRFASGPDEDDDNDTYDQKPMGRVADGIRPLCVANE